MALEDTVAAFDQASALLADTLAPMLWRFFCGCRGEGFTPPESLLLTLRLLDQAVKGTPKVEDDKE